MAENHIAYDAPAPEAATHEPASPSDFDPVPVRHRIDGWTREKQRDYVEALAAGVARYAAALVGMTEQSASRLRRRPDARSFDRACDLAMRHGARRVVSIAFERVIEGTIKRHYYHGELKSEERVYDNRLLIALLGKLGPLLAPEERAAAADQWQPWMDAIEQGLPKPPPAPLEDENGGDEVWEEDGTWWTCFPPPPGFAGRKEGVPGTYEYYRRELSKAELAAIGPSSADEQEEELARQAARRDRYFGSTPEPLAGSAADAEGDAQAAVEDGEGRPTGPEGSSNFVGTPASGKADWTEACPERPPFAHDRGAAPPRLHPAPHPQTFSALGPEPYEPSEPLQPDGQTQERRPRHAEPPLSALEARFTGRSR